MVKSDLSHNLGCNFSFVRPCLSRNVKGSKGPMEQNGFVDCNSTTVQLFNLSKVLETIGL
jgi:hypothetical protein